ncbi:MAG TPA: HaeII family restriction endonuclease [Anaerolineae bacterium]|nr:HaeII family restriction endonuclease [Anaerolineae bacterium]
MTVSIERAKDKLDILIGKQRAVMYKPIQIIAEILYHTRLGELTPDDLRYHLETYRNPSNMDLLREFERSAQLVLGIDCEHPSITVPANLYRAGVTNAADRGLDMWANFGPAIQVKHLNLTEDLTGEICDTITTDRIVIVCKDFEREQIERVCRQLGLSRRIQDIITQNDLIEWYDTALRGKFAAELGADLSKSLLVEFQSEFPFSKTYGDFYKRRGYASIRPSNSIFWQADDDQVHQQSLC